MQIWKKDTSTERAAWSLFDRRKVHRKSNHITGPPTPSVGSSASRITVLPENWQSHMNGEDVNNYYQLETPTNLSSLSVIVHGDQTWNVFVYGMKVPRTNTLLQGFPDCISAPTLTELIDTVNLAVFCPGNPENKFVEICQKRGGVFRGERGLGQVVASIDSTGCVKGEL